MEEEIKQAYKLYFTNAIGFEGLIAKINHIYLKYEGRILIRK